MTIILIVMMRDDGDENDNYDEKGDYSHRVYLQETFWHAAKMMMVMHLHW